jgi:hypothetical protein
MKKFDDLIVKLLLRIVIYPPVSPPVFKVTVTYEGRGKYERTFPFDKSTVTILNAKLIPFDAQNASVENWLIFKLKANDPIV